MNEEKNFILEPKERSSSADEYCKIGDIGLAIQTKNGKQKIGWKSIHEELGKMGTFKPFMYYVFGCMTLSKGLSSMLNNDGFLSLPSGKYYYDIRGKDYSFLFHVTINYEFVVLHNQQTYNLKLSTPSMRESINFQGKVHICRLKSQKDHRNNSYWRQVYH